MTGCERILARLERGPATAAELYALGVMVHSRVADLRKRGHDIRCEHIDGKGTGTEAFEYRLVGLLVEGRGHVDAAAPLSEGADFTERELRPSASSSVSGSGGMFAGHAAADAGLTHGAGVPEPEVLEGQLSIEDVAA